jgi:predicted nucleotidyltransferase
MANLVDPIETLVPGAQGRMLGALLRLDGPRTISEVARLADVSRDRAADVVSLLERLGVVERRPAGRAHLVAVIEEHPITQSLRDIERTHDRTIDALRRAATSIDPAPRFMAIYGSWAREEATVDSDLDVAVVADPSADHDALLASLDEWAVVAGRVTGRRPSLLIAERPAEARGPVWTSVRRDGITLVDGERDADGS